MTDMTAAATQPAQLGGFFHDREYAYARISPGHGRSWLRLLAGGWSFCGDVVEPMNAHHGRYAVLMHRECDE